MSTPTRKRTAAKTAATKPAKAKSQSKTAEPLGSYILIRNRRVIGESFEGLSEAIAERQASPEGVSIFCQVVREPQHSHKVLEEGPKPNPVANALETLSHVVEVDILDVFEKEVGEGSSFSDGANSRGLIYSGMSGGEPRTATNEECATWFADVSLEAKFDRRKKLPPQVAKWLRKQAAAFIKVAAQVEAIEDDRNMKVIRKVVADELFMPSVIAQNLEFEYDGSLVPDPMAEYRAKQAEESSN